ncbi:hypothetical protein FGIG_09971 [Fasciola gigantica]|uniref:Delta-like protein n=1 Tax=Fasciola gigantica TaxID=46835 RepID=A0A504YG04_FASGI|nr:hypothetical protein FGIG_09971 [Fasciola gigantica]
MGVRLYVQPSISQYFATHVKLRERRDQVGTSGPLIPMVSITTDLLWLTVTSLYFVSIQPKPVYSSLPVGAQIDFVWEYRNPRRLLQKGPKWVSKVNGKIMFQFCLRRPKQNVCDMWKADMKGYKTETHLKDSIRAAIATPVPDELVLEVDIKVTWLGMLPTLVASFTSPPIFMTANGNKQEVKLIREGQHHRNDDVTFSVELKLTCSEYFYGKKCETYCRPVVHRFDCSPIGEKVCYPGLTGEQCNHRDVCYFQPCAENSTCENLPDGSARRCICNGKHDSSCYPNFNACMLGPCKNGGSCQTTGKNGLDFTCLCKSMWQGPTCSVRRSACDEKANQLRQTLLMNDPSVDPNSSSVNVCMNGGRCFEDPDGFAFYCVCSDGWTGERCDRPRTKSYSDQYLLFILGIPLAAFILLICASTTVVAVCCHHHKMKKANRVQQQHLPSHAEYMPGSQRQSAPLPKSKLPSFSNNRPFTLFGLPTIPIRNKPLLPVNKPESSVYAECSDSGYVDMGPFNPIYHSDSTTLPWDAQEPVAPTLPERPYFFRNESSLGPTSSGPSVMAKSTEYERTPLKVATLGSSSTRHTATVQSIRKIS